MKRYLAGLIFSLWSSLALAGVPCTLPFNLQNGTTADATQVMANYNQLVTCLGNAAAAGANNDITSLLALTTPITPTQGGSNVYIGGTSTGSANAQVVGSVVPLNFSLAVGKRIVFVPGFTNTGATTFNVNGAGATNVFRMSPDGPQALTGGEIITNNVVEAVYDGTQFELLSANTQFGGAGTRLTLASATTTDLGTAATHNISISGVTTITSFGSSASVTFPLYQVQFQGMLTLTHNASSLILPGNASIVTAAGDQALAAYLGSGNWRVINYTKQNGAATSTSVPTRQIFLSGSGTYTTPANMRWMRIRMVGGGAGGGGGNSSSTSTVGGATCWATSGAACSSPVLTANGGAGGSAIIQTPAGGSASGGNVLNIAGGQAGPPSGAANVGSGVGGSSCLGGAGGGNDSTGTGGAAAANSGSGGGGGGGNSTTSVPSGGGAGGCVEHVITTPAATYTYAIGTGGAGAAGSGGGGTGGAGAAGQIIVEEFY